MALLGVVTAIELLLGLGLVGIAAGVGGPVWNAHWALSGLLAGAVVLVALFAAHEAFGPWLTLRLAVVVKDTPRDREVFFASVLVATAQSSMATAACGVIGAFVVQDVRFYMATLVVCGLALVPAWPTMVRRTRWEALLRKRGVLGAAGKLQEPENT